MEHAIKILERELETWEWMVERALPAFKKSFEDKVDGLNKAIYKLKR